MPNILSDENKRVLDELLDGYNALPWYKKLFYPGALSTALTQYHTNERSYDSAVAVCESYLNKTWFFQRWFFSSLGVFSRSSLGLALTRLNNAGLLKGEAAQENRDAIIGHQNPLHRFRSLGQLNNSLGILIYAGLLTSKAAQANFNAIVRLRYQYSSESLALYMLNNAGLLTGEVAQANFNAIVGHHEPLGAAFALGKLNEAGLLTGGAAQVNRNAIVGHQSPDCVNNVLRALNDAGLLTDDAAQGIFDGIAITHRDILTHTDTRLLWDRIPRHLLTTARFDAIITICNDNRDNPAQGRRLFTDYVNREILGIEAGRAPAAAVFNPAQSTHTASVHESVTASARKLNTLYGAKITDHKLDDVMKDISGWLMTETGDPLKLNAAKRCLQRLTGRDSNFTDPGSRVSTKQLLALAWVAIHDEAMRVGSLDNAKALFIEGLYEIQRGYNIEYGRNDVKDGDLPICTAGTFNKIMEKLVGIHKEVEVLYITREGASAKFQIAINETAITYLRELSAKPEGQKPLVELVRQIKAPTNGNSAEPIWELIKNVVTDIIFNEFMSVFDNNKQSADFVGFMNAGVDVKLTDAILAALDELVVSASGLEGASASTQGFFARKDDAASGGDEGSVADQAHREPPKQQ